MEASPFFHFLVSLFCALSPFLFQPRLHHSVVFSPFHSSIVLYLSSAFKFIFPCRSVLYPTLVFYSFKSCLFGSSQSYPMLSFISKFLRHGWTDGRTKQMGLPWLWMHYRLRSFKAMVSVDSDSQPAALATAPAAAAGASAVRASAKLMLAGIGLMQCSARGRRVCATDIDDIDWKPSIGNRRRHGNGSMRDASTNPLPELLLLLLGRRWRFR